MLGVAGFIEGITTEGIAVTDGELVTIAFGVAVGVLDTDEIKFPCVLINSISGLFFTGPNC